MTEAKKLRICLAIVAALTLIIATMAYKFIIAGSTGETHDGRVPVLLESAERLFVLKEMRGLLSGVQQLSAALARDDLAQAARLARSMGREADSAERATLMGKLPLAFKTMGLGVHADFDDMANRAESAAGTKVSSKELLLQLSGTLQKCVACHAQFQLELPPPAKSAQSGHSARIVASSGD